MNPYLKNLNRIEFVVTMACTGRCKHCSEGSHTGDGPHIDSAAAVKVVRDLCGAYRIESLMTFGGEPLLHPETVCQIHAAAREEGIPSRQLITNGYFSRDVSRIRQVADSLIENGVNDILLSVDAFHQETIPLEPVKEFALAVKRVGGKIRLSPAWLISEEDENPYNQRTREILKEFEEPEIPVGGGNVIFPKGNAMVYLKEYFTEGSTSANPYEENPLDVRAVSIGPDGTVSEGTVEGNVYQEDILPILERYQPKL